MKYSEMQCEACGSYGLYWHDGMLGYEALVCKKCGHHHDQNAKTPIHSPGPWHAMFSGPASTPLWTIRAGATFKEALEGEIICTLPGTTTSTAERVSANAKLLAASVKMLQALELILEHTERPKDPTTRGYMPPDSGWIHETAAAAVMAAKGQLP